MTDIELTRERKHLSRTLIELEQNTARGKVLAERALEAVARIEELQRERVEHG